MLSSPTLARALVFVSALAMAACDPGAEPLPGAASSEKVMVEAAEAPVLREASDGSYLFDPGDESFAAIVYPTGEVAFRDYTEAGFSEVGIRVSGYEDWKAHGEKKAKHGRRKAEFLRATAERRAELAASYATQGSGRALEQLDLELRALALELAEDPATLRRRLFELWDDCAEGEATPEHSTVDKARLEHGRAARQQIESFIRAQLPQDGPKAYTPAELAKLNAARASQAEFAPYAPAD